MVKGINCLYLICIVNSFPMTTLTGIALLIWKFWVKIYLEKQIVQNNRTETLIIPLVRKYH